MNYLRLIKDSQPENEFFSSDTSIRYLGNIKEFNIIIGANNTRKSRFIRRIISLQHKVIIKSELEINEMFQKMESIFDGVDKRLIDVNLISFIFNQPPSPSQKYSEVDNYLSLQKSRSNQLTFFDIRNTLQNLLSTVDTLAVEDNLKALENITLRAHETFQLVLEIYKKLNTSFIPSWDTPNPTDIPGITYKITAGFTGDHIDDLDEKIKILSSVVECTTLFRQLKFELHHKDMMVYIPVLRTSRRLVGASPDLYKKTIQQQHKLEDNAKLTIETGLDLYEKIEVARNGHRSDRERFAGFEKFVSDVFFQSRSIDIIAVKSSTDSERHVKVSLDGEQDDIPIHDLGDGIQAIINLLLPVFTAGDGSWIFIDEPENHLHPGYQNVFINAISRNEHIRKKKLKFFINTHSNHVLSEALLGNADTEIFVFSRRDKDSSNIVTFDGNEYNTLEMLGVFNTSVLISNCSIWVEGITDRLYLKAFLFAYYNREQNSDSAPVEGLNYSFIEYAGNNLLHYSFDHDLSSKADNVGKDIKAFFINSNVFLVADSDFGKEEKHQFYQELEVDKNFKYFQTGLPEIENLIPDSVLKSWLITDLKCSSEEVETCFAIVNQNEKLGKYFDEKFSYRKSKRKFTKQGIGGTLRGDLKLRLANFVHNGIMDKSISWADLEKSLVIKKLITDLDGFLREKNSRDCS
jgi:hypothetical protein